ncbi:exported hypothetical protein [uncultured Alphaproteobacteria bacterium]|uniref:Sel1 repeat family protein n=1 Tax=uncultured Alphaproteobacteria bacterium TaxID=91750 RepID=A0A212KMK3_9PROT|nr:exported hypothetical protein [uncultured Alphaproteobacteria bacterium]
MRLPLAALCLALSFAPAAAQTVEDGFEAYDAGDYATAKTILLPLAEAGDARAMNLIGYMYDFGKGFPKNKTAACDWYEKAAGIGEAIAQGNLSFCFEHGEGRPKDIPKAIYWDERAAEQGYLDSQINLVRYYRDIDPIKAEKWALEALKSGTAISRVSAWYANVKYPGPSASFLDKICVGVMNGLFHRPILTCDKLIKAHSLD